MTTVKKETRKGRNGDDCLVFVFEELGEKEVSLFLDNEIKRIKKDMISFSEGFEDPIIVDFSNVRFVSVLFLGILLILRNQNKKSFFVDFLRHLKRYSQ